MKIIHKIGRKQYLQISLPISYKNMKYVENKEKKLKKMGGIPIGITDVKGGGLFGRTRGSLNYLIPVTKVKGLSKVI